MPHIFISYSSKNDIAAKFCCDALERAGHRCWIAPRDIPPGSVYADAIVARLRDCGMVLLVFSEDSNSSSHVRKELERAVSWNRPILSLRLDASPCSDALTYFVADSQWIDASTGPLESHVDALIDAVGRVSKVIFRDSVLVRDDPSQVADTHNEIKALDQRIQNDPTDPEAFKARAEAFVHLGDNEAALLDYERAIALRDRYFDAFMGRAICQFNRGDYKAALADYSNAIEIEPTEAALFLRSVVFAKIGDAEAQLRDLDKAVALHGGAMALRGRGQLHQAAGRHREAIDDYTKALEKTPRDLQIVTLRARAHMALGALDDARLDLEHAVENDPNDADALSMLGEVGVLTQDYANAAIHLERSLKIRPNDVRALVSSAVASFACGRVRAALSDAKRALEISPNLEAALWTRGRCENALGYHEQAVATFSTLIPTGYPGCYSCRAEAYSRLNRPQEAAADYEQALKEEPDDPILWVNAGSVLGFLGHLKEAETHFSRSIELDPRKVATLISRGRNRLALQDVAGAKRDFDAALVLDRDNARAHMGNGDCLAIAKNFAAALPSYDRAVELGLREELLFLNRGISRQNTGDVEGAVQDYAAVLNLNRGNTIARNALAQLGYQVNE